MHAGFVVAAKTWPLIARADPHVPRWLVGPGPVPLIAAPAAWILSIVLMALLAVLFKPRDANADQRGISRAS
jgi:hypothetical protein